MLSDSSFWILKRLQWRRKQIESAGGRGRSYQKSWQEKKKDYGCGHKKGIKKVGEGLSSPLDSPPPPPGSDRCLCVLIKKAYDISWNSISLTILESAWVYSKYLYFVYDFFPLIFMKYIQLYLVRTIGKLVQPYSNGEAWDHKKILERL